MKIDSTWLTWSRVIKKLVRRLTTLLVPFVPWLSSSQLSVKVVILFSALSVLIHGLPRTSTAQKNAKEMKLSHLELCIGSLSKSLKHLSSSVKQANAKLLRNMVLLLSTFIHVTNRCRPAHKVVEWECMVKISSITFKSSAPRPSMSARNVMKKF